MISLLFVMIFSTMVESSCVLNGETYPDSSISYIVGGPHRPGSIYMRCNGRKSTCFLDDGRADVVDAETPCESAYSADRQLGVLLAPTQLVWPNGAMCYRTPTILTPAEQAIFAQGVNEFKLKTNMRVISLEECAIQADAAAICGGCVNALTVSRDFGCSSFNGYRNEVAQDISFTPDCFFDRANQPGADPLVRAPSANTVIHELGHAAGLYHEHTHPQRNLAILRDSLRSAPENYIKNTQAVATAYDTYSIMHFSLNSEMCVPKAEFAALTFCDVNELPATTGCTVATEIHCDRANVAQTYVGGAATFSAGDIAGLAQLYPTKYPQAELAAATPNLRCVPT